MTRQTFPGFLPKRRISGKTRALRRLGRLTAGLSTVALAGALAGCTDGDGDPTPQVREGSVGLHAFAGCDPLLDYFHEEALSFIDIIAAGGGGYDAVDVPSAGEALDDAGGGQAGGEGDRGPSFSGTNVQEAGVDEPDFVKTDGRYLYALRNGHLLIHDAADLTELSSTPHVDGSALLLDGDRLVVLGSTWGAPSEPFADANPVRRDHGAKVVVDLYDVSDRAAPTRVERTYVEGHLVAARLAGGTARVVVHSNPIDSIGYDPRFANIDGGGGEGRAPAPVDSDGGGSSSAGSAGTGGADGSGEDDAPPPAERIGQSSHAQVDGDDRFDALRGLIAETTIDDWLPLAFTVDAAGERVSPVVACNRVSRPGERAGFGVTSVLSVDLDQPDAPRDDPAVVTGAGVVYAGTDALYVTTPNPGVFFGRGGEDVAVAVTDEGEAATSAADTDGRIGQRAMGLEAADDGREATQVHRFDISDATGPATYRASGRVYGTPLNQFSLSAHQGHLRVATTERPVDGGDIVNHLYVLGEGTDADGDAALQITGRIEDLAPTERIYAARYQGERGFLVTFRQVDPLFTLDLSDPAAPALLGELKIPGFSTYLHPLGADHLIGIGQSATDEGAITGMQLSLFDVSDLADPQLAYAEPLGDGYSEALYDHHAFTYWAPESLLMVPVWRWDDRDATEQSGLELFRVDTETGFAGSGFIDHSDLRPDLGYGGEVRRSLVIGDVIYSISEHGIKANTIDDLAEQGRAVYPDWPEGSRGGRDGGEPEPAPAPVDAEPQGD